MRTEKILANVEQKNLESKVIGAGTGEPVDFVFETSKKIAIALPNGSTPLAST